VKISKLKFVPVAAVVLLFAGCESMPGFGGGDDEVDRPPADVVEAGAETSGAQHGTQWSGGELDDPASPLYNKVIYFGYDTSSIDPEYRDIVITHGQYLAANPEVAVSVEGHCDERGSREYNIGLGERRSNSVRDLLLAQGVANSQIVTISYGEERPAELGSSEGAWAKNRRVELVYGLQR
jgi:peptidoglycan-associated lipoprotein